MSSSSSYRGVRDLARVVRRASSSSSSSSSSDNPMKFLLENPLKLYRDCIRLADFLAHKQGYPRDVLRATVRAPWRQNQGETDPEKIVDQREAAIRGLSNYMMYEASKGAMEGVPAFAPEDDEETTKRGS